jgi:hypothetical protein
LMDQFMASYHRPPAVMVLEVDATADRPHGAQAQSRYDGYDGGAYSARKLPSIPRQSCH